ncbi:MAG: hypothetical protein GM46_2265 [actinobacterium acAcidi]|nr:MAG: hypothetical protein GM46_2265 [actinobacterium acAcidi]
MRRKREVGPVTANDDGTYTINLQVHERETMLDLVSQLETVLSSGPDDERLRRLYPTAYNENPEHDAEYQGFMRDELTQSRAASIATVREMLRSDSPVTENQLGAFMMVLNNLRLILGTLLDVNEDDDEPDDADPLYGQWQLYGYLGWLLEWVISSLSEK